MTTSSITPTKRKLGYVYLYSKPESHNEDTDPLDLYFDEIKDAKVYTPEQEKQIAKKVKQGDEKAKEEFISSNLKLVISVAKKYLYSCLSFGDLIQEGNLGLLKAVDKFNPDLDFKFSTYATFWINQSITTAIASNGKSVGVPTHVVDDINHYHKTSQLLFDKLGREANNDEIRLEMGFSENKFQKLLEVLPSHISLDMKVGEDGGDTAGELLEDKETPTPDINAQILVFREELIGLMSDILTDRENTILKYRFGFVGEKATLEEISDLFGITRERVRQLEKQGISKLKENNRFQQLVGV